MGGSRWLPSRGRHQHKSAVIQNFLEQNQWKDELDNDYCFAFAMWGERFSNHISFPLESPEESHPDEDQTPRLELQTCAAQGVSNDRTACETIPRLVLRIKFRLSFGAGEQRAVRGVRLSCSRHRVAEDAPRRVSLALFSAGLTRGACRLALEQLFRFSHQQRG